MEGKVKFSDLGINDILNALPEGLPCDGSNHQGALIINEEQSLNDIIRSLFAGAVKNGHNMPICIAVVPQSNIPVIHIYYNNGSSVRSLEGEDPIDEEKYHTLPGFVINHLSARSVIVLLETKDGSYYILPNSGVDMDTGDMLGD